MHSAQQPRILPYKGRVPQPLRAQRGLAKLSQNPHTMARPIVLDAFDQMSTCRRLTKGKVHIRTGQSYPSYLLMCLLPIFRQSPENLGQKITPGFTTIHRGS